MAERQPAQERRKIAPKDVFDRSNMPSRWERITSVSPKTPWDRKYLSFVAARYRGEKRLPHPDELEVPAEFYMRKQAQYLGWTAVAVAVVLVAIGTAIEAPALAALGVVVLVSAGAVLVFVWRLTESAVHSYQAERSRCRRALSRLYADSLDSQNTLTVNKMINCDEGTLAYCAAKIASELEQDPAWWSPHLGFIAINLWDEVAGIGLSAKQIAGDRKALEALERGRLCNAPDVRATINEYKKLRKEAIALLATRVYAFADYRDRVRRHGIAARRADAELKGVMRSVEDEQGRERLL
jgi:hypothetical protein